VLSAFRSQAFADLRAFPLPVKSLIMRSDQMGGLRPPEPSPKLRRTAASALGEADEQ
jgi:hypothetical protein